MRILIAEDDQASRKILSGLLSAFGPCDTAADGVEAVDAFLKALEEEQPYDLICLDIIMPRMDGLMALKSIRGIERQRGIPGEQAVKVIVATALSQTKDIAEAISAGFEAYIAKPVDMDRLLEAMKALKLLKE